MKRVVLYLCIGLLFQTQLSFARSKQAGYRKVADSPESSALIKPAAEWSGTLVLPKPEERKSDGGIWIVLKNSPDPSQVGQKLWLSYGPPSSSVQAQEYYLQFFDVNFTKTAWQDIQKNQVVLPTRLDGWKNVSPLESLAAALPTDDVQVMLESPKLEGDSLVIHSEPIQISDHQMIYIQFVKTNSDGRFEVVHYNPATDDFTGPHGEVKVLYPDSVHDDHMTKPISWAGIENNPANPKGWLAWGETLPDGTFGIRAIEPTDLFETTNFKSLKSKDEILNYFNHDEWNLGASLQETERRISIDRFGEPSMTIGTKFLVVHGFGANKSIDKDIVGPLVFYSGHFAFGVAQVIPHPFSGKPKIDVVYNQVYASNSNHVVSGRNAYHHYADDTQLEIAITRPVSDVLVPMPELFRGYDTGTRVIEPEDLLQTQFSFMQAIYRIGAGTGVTIVESHTSCVQDACQVVLNGIATLKHMAHTDADLRAWLKADGHPDDVKSFKRLIKWADRVRGKIGMDTPVLDLIAGMKQGAYVPFAFRNPETTPLIEEILLTLRSLPTVFPRATHDLLIETALEMHSPFVVLQTFDTLSKDPNYVPIGEQAPVGGGVHPNGILGFFGFW